MKAAYKCRAYPDPVQASVLNRTSGCVRVAWNQTLAWRRQRYHAGKAGDEPGPGERLPDRHEATEELTWLNEVSSVPLQQAIRHQQAAYAAAVNPSTVTVSRDPCGRWYVSLAVDVPEPEQFPRD